MRASFLLFLITWGCWCTALEARTGRVHARPKTTTSAFDGFRRAVVNHTVNYAPSPTNWLPANGSRIAYGRTAQTGQFPFAVWLTASQTTCGGSLIAPRVVLTAARCVTRADGSWTDIQNLILKMGSASLQSSTVYTLQTVVTPGNYDPQSSFGDLAIIELDRPSTLKSVTLVDPLINLNGMNALTVLGWGATQRSRTSSSLQYSAMSYISSLAKCSAYLAKYGLGAGLPPDHFCVGMDSSRSSACKGDAGDPYIIAGSNPIQVGVASYDVAGYRCGGSTNLDLPTSVSYWSGWIQDTLSLYNLRGTKPPTRLNTIAFQTCFMQAAYKFYRSGSAGACCDACRTDTKCLAWTFYGGTSMCALKKTRGTLRSSSNCVSGTIY